MQVSLAFVYRWTLQILCLSDIGWNIDFPYFHMHIVHIHLGYMIETYTWSKHSKYLYTFTIIYSPLYMHCGYWILLTCYVTIKTVLEFTAIFKHNIIELCTFVTYNIYAYPNVAMYILWFNYDYDFTIDWYKYVMFDHNNKQMF